MLKSYHTEDLVEAGVDEAGRGCLAGPVVAASVILPKDYHHPVLNDSKQLSKKQRELLREEIKRDAISWAIAEVSHTVIDEINILNASFLAMHKAIGKLKTKPELLLIDGNRFKPYKKTSHHCIVEGDAKYLSIAAASVLAKTYRDDLMVKLASKFPVYDWENNMGYGTPKHREAIFLNGLSPFHRLSFKLDKSSADSQLNLF
ncbi:MAG: ribonuclease HII [Sporocytophaga sp.]|uniref:ribonuclease HII n=1 Tax=Sporocytophaga sp. TaxID=2231183 RepID=UPI001B1F1ECA|nr:ribonuclease HII [Sporocytophaga sp.]MBO9699464.1 ribonuclease HII [Sporocytophaga sp.]